MTPPSLTFERAGQLEPESIEALRQKLMAQKLQTRVAIVQMHRLMVQLRTESSARAKGQVG
ncbi:unnamed protein product [Protopolystoma xenopodis]|uniref:Uncharacterized protein n=1 Tax=Protopolystoma xenopodis TaxID=117903 RepID=A0A448WU13_9PLAT|nr:unnamed protein product [Protopolystoma xenopodis]